LHFHFSGAILKMQVKDSTMKDREKLESIFRQIAEGFNLTEGEIAETLKLPLEGLKNAIKDCFRQIEQPREKFTVEEYDYLTKEIGCVNLGEQLEDEPLQPYRTMQEQIVSCIFDMPLKFTADELCIRMYLSGFQKGTHLDCTVRNTLDLLSHQKVKYLVKDGEYYSLNLNAKIG
jgi:hypothetical protein